MVHMCGLYQYTFIILWPNDCSRTSCLGENNPQYTAAYTTTTLRLQSRHSVTTNDATGQEVSPFKDLMVRCSSGQVLFSPLKLQLWHIEAPSFATANDGATSPLNLSHKDTEPCFIKAIMKTLGKWGENNWEKIFHWLVVVHFGHVKCRPIFTPALLNASGDEKILACTVVSSPLLLRQSRRNSGQCTGFRPWLKYNPLPSIVYCYRCLDLNVKKIQWWVTQSMLTESPRSTAEDLRPDRKRLDTHSLLWRLLL